MTSAVDLFGLQEIDLSRDKCRALVADIEARLGETDELVATREALTDAQAALAELRKQQRDVDGWLEDLDAKIRPFEEKLYGGSVRNPKELTNLQREVEILKAQRSKLDDQGLENLEATERAVAALEMARQQLAAVETAWQADQAEMLLTKGRVEQEAHMLEEERRRRTAGMEALALSQYEALRLVRQGRAVARIERGACQGCRLSLPTHVVQRARVAGTLVQCPSCERILLAS